MTLFISSCSMAVGGLGAFLLLGAGFQPLQAQDSDQIYYFPHLAVGAGWQTTITYINYSPEDVTCQTDFLSDDGTPLMVSFAGLGRVVSRTDVLPPGGAVHQETNVELSTPLAPGWARGNCSRPVKASLLFRRYNSEGVPIGEAAVNATTLPTTGFVTFAEQGVGQFGTGVAYANPSAVAALVTFTARDGAGQTLASVSHSLPPGGHGSQNMVDLFGLTSFSGSLEVTSTEPIVSLSLNFEADPVFSSLPPGELDTSSQGSATYYFPHLAVGASWQTTITYINYSPQEVTCRTDFISDHGSPLTVLFPGLGAVVSRTDVLPAGGAVHQETNVELSTPLAPGWARGNCSGPVKASLLFRRYNSEGVPIGEAAVNATTLPTTGFVTFAEQGVGQFGTGVAYANPSAVAALVTFTARDGAGQTLASVSHSLPPGGHGSQNMVDLFGLTSFSGSLEVTSTEPIVSLSLNFEADPVFSSLPPGETPGLENREPHHNVIVRVVRVTPDWHGYVIRGGGWPSAVPVKESDVLKYFEVAIWEETMSIHFYEFDNDFDPYGNDRTPEQVTAHRESYTILRVDGMPGPWTEARSRFIKQAFADFVSILTKRYPDSDHHLMYNGHGGPGGRLFAAQLTYGDADDLLANWTRALGRPLGVIDMGGPCNKGSFSDLENFCTYAQYYVASDLPNGGYTMDDWTLEKYLETDPESQYHRLFAENSTLKEALLGRIAIKRRAYEYSRINMTESRAQQANYLYSCREFADFGPAFRKFLSSQDGDYSISDDLYDYMAAHRAGNDLLVRFDDVFVHRADNRDFFEWEPGANGMLMPDPTR